MEIKKFTVYVNKVHEEEQALVDENDSVVMMGDYYHDKIDDKICGFFEGLDYMNVKHEKTTKTISPKDELFYKFGFCEDED